MGAWIFMGIGTAYCLFVLVALFPRKKKEVKPKVIEYDTKFGEIAHLE